MLVVGLFTTISVSQFAPTLARYATCISTPTVDNPLTQQFVKAMSPELRQKKLVYSDPGYLCNQLYSVYSANSDGSNQQTIFTSSKASAKDPVWSPDGTKLLINQGDSEIDIVNGNGTNPIKVTTIDPSQGMLYYPKWSPDGKQITFVGNNGSPLLKTFIVNIDGSDLLELPNSSELIDYVVSWSPDSSRIVYTEKTAEGNYEIYLMDRDGSNPSKLADGSQADWSPDGKQIAFATNTWTLTQSQAPQLHSAITVIAPDGSGMKELFVAEHGQYVYAPVWSPKGTYIAFGVAALVPDVQKGNLDIYVIQADGSNPMSINAHPQDATRKFQSTASPVWSFDEQFIAYGLSRDDGFTGTHDIGLTEVSSGKSIVLIENALAPAWQP